MAIVLQYLLELVISEIKCFASDRQMKIKELPMFSFSRQGCSVRVRLAAKVLPSFLAARYLVGRLRDSSVRSSEASSLYAQTRSYRTTVYAIGA